MWFGNGDGTFRSAAGISFGCTSGAPGAPAVGDFNEDGSLDLAVVESVTSSVLVAINKGDGTFGSPVSYSIPSGSSLMTADINGDRHLDLVTDTGAVLLGKGDGAFASGQSAPTGGSIVGDFNGDGKLDLVSPGNPSCASIEPLAFDTG